MEYYESHEACQRAFEMVLRDDPIMKTLEAALKEMPESELNLEGDGLPDAVESLNLSDTEKTALTPRPS